jgi:hypothetical protein
MTVPKPKHLTNGYGIYGPEKIDDEARFIIPAIYLKNGKT